MSERSGDESHTPVLYLWQAVTLPSGNRRPFLVPHLSIQIRADLTLAPSAFCLQPPRPRNTATSAQPAIISPPLAQAQNPRRQFAGTVQLDHFQIGIVHARSDFRLCKTDDSGEADRLALPLTPGCVHRRPRPHSWRPPNVTEPQTRRPSNSVS